MILVTGGAGFIGSNLLAALETRGLHDLVVCDWLGRDGKWRNIAKRELAKIVAPEDLRTFLERHDVKTNLKAIFHMGAVSSTTETDADLIARTNIALPQYLWSWCAENDCRFIYASSAATYGDGTQGFADHSSPAALSKLRPLNPYGWSKLAFDRLVARQVQTNATDRPPQWAGLRFFNVYGPNEYHKGSMKSVAAQLFSRLAADQPARLFRSHRPEYEDGGQMRDFVSVDDCVAGMLWLFDHPDVSGLFNIGSGKARNFLELANAVFDAIGREPEIEYVDTPVEIRGRYQYFTQADMTRFRAAGFNQAPTELEDGIRDYVTRYLMADDPYR